MLIEIHEGDVECPQKLKGGDAAKLVGKVIAQNHSISRGRLSAYSPQNRKSVTELMRMLETFRRYLQWFYDYDMPVVNSSLFPSSGHFVVFLPGPPSSGRGSYHCLPLSTTRNADLPLILILSVYTDFLLLEFGKIQIFLLEIGQNTDFFFRNAKGFSLYFL